MVRLRVEVIIVLSILHESRVAHPLSYHIVGIVVVVVEVVVVVVAVVLFLVV